MLSPKAGLYAIIVFAFTACTKQDTILPTATTHANNISTAQLQLPLVQTTFGLMEEQATTEQMQADMNGAGIKLIRMPIFLSLSTKSKTIDDYLSGGYNVQINANWDPGTNGSFPTDTNLLKSQADAFFKYYSPYKSQIPFVAVENEWDWEVSVGGKLPDYFNELSIITSIGHKYGFKIADAGIRSSTLGRWTYSQLSGNAQQQWLNCYYVGLSADYGGLLNMVNTYTAGVQKINFDYSNIHWYNASKCSNGFATASQAFMKACNKKVVVCNEFGVYTNSYDLFNATVNEIKGNTSCAVAYSGLGGINKAITLTAAMLALL